MKVKDFYDNVIVTHGEIIARRFLKLMIEWDGEYTVLGAFYEEDLLKIKLKEAQELQHRAQHGIISDRDDFIDMDELCNYPEHRVAEYAQEHFENCLSLEKNLKNFLKWAKNKYNN